MKPKLKFESTLDDAKTILDNQSVEPIHQLPTTEQFNLATAHYILATHLHAEQPSESSEQAIKLHLNSALLHLSHVSKKTHLWRDQIVYTYFKRAELQEQQGNFNQAVLDYEQALHLFKTDPTPNPINIPTDIKLIAVQSAIAISDLMLSGEITHPKFQSQSLAFEYLKFALYSLDLFPELTKSMPKPHPRRRRTRFPFDHLQGNQDYIHACAHAYQLAGLYFSSPPYHAYQPDTAQYYFHQAIHAALQLVPHHQTAHYLAELYHSLASWHQLPVHSLKRQASASYYGILAYLFSSHDWPLEPHELEDSEAVVMDAQLEFSFFEKRCMTINRPLKTPVCRITLVHFIDGLNFILGLLDLEDRAIPNQMVLNFCPLHSLKKLLNQLLQKAYLELFQLDHPHSKSHTFSKPKSQSRLLLDYSSEQNISKSYWVETIDKN